MRELNLWIYPNQRGAPSEKRKHEGLSWLGRPKEECSRRSAQYSILLRPFTFGVAAVFEQAE